MTVQVTTAKGGDLPLQQKLDNLQKGDKILFNDRKKPLTVRSIDQYEFEEGDSYMGTLEGPNGAEYNLVQSLKNSEIVSIKSTALTSDSQVITELEVLEHEW